MIGGTIAILKKPTVYLYIVSSKQDLSKVISENKTVGNSPVSNMSWLLNRSTEHSVIQGTKRAVQNEQRCCSAEEEGFKKHYKRAVKALAAAVANFGCSGKHFDSDKQRCCSSAENSRITICAAKWLQSGFEKTKNVVASNGLPLSSKKKRNAGSIIQ